MKILIAVFLIIICTTALGISEESKNQEFKIPNKFNPKEEIMAEKFNENYKAIEKKIAAIDELIHTLKQSLENTQNSLVQLEKFDSQLQEVNDHFTNFKNDFSQYANEEIKKIEKKSGIPKGTVAAFDLPACPDGWSYFDKGAGRVILGVGKGYRLKEIGGKETHKLTINELPEHTHPWLQGVTGDDSGSGGGPKEYAVYQKEKGPNPVGYTGSNQPHNNMPPFITLRFCQKD